LTSRRKTVTADANTLAVATKAAMRAAAGRRNNADIRSARSLGASVPRHFVSARIRQDDQMGEAVDDPSAG